MNPYEQKYAGVDLEFTDVEAIESSKECQWLMVELDHQIASIQFDVDEATAKRQKGHGKADPLWWAEAKAELKQSKVTRNAVQLRHGVLGKIERANRGKETALRFIDAAMEILPKETIQLIWARLHMSDDTKAESK